LEQRERFFHTGEGGRRFFASGGLERAFECLTGKAEADVKLV
jgi:hypothetical protein